MRRTAAVFLSGAAGLLLGVLVRVNAGLGETIGMLEATFVVHVVGTGFGALLAGRWLSLAFGREVLRGGHYHELTGGLLGVAMVLISNVVVSRLGVALGVSLFVAADLLASALADRAGWLRLRRRSLSARRVIGILTAIAGVLLIRWA